MLQIIATATAFIIPVLKPSVFLPLHETAEMRCSVQGLIYYLHI
jgi:hypothetical protein